MESVPKDVTIEMMLELDFRSILSLCTTNSKLNTICKLPSFWKRKIQKEFPIINLENVREYRNLYFYLKKKPRFNPTRKPKLGDLSAGGKYIFGSGKSEGKYYDIFPKDRNKLIDFFRYSAIEFPLFPPEYFRFFESDFLFPEQIYLSERDTDMVFLNYKSARELAKNIEGNRSFITGPFGERYEVIIKVDNVSDEFFIELIENLKIIRSPTLIRFASDVFYLDFRDRLEHMTHPDIF